MGKRIDCLIEYNNVLVACDKEDETHIYAWACFGTKSYPTCLNFVFVKREYRRIGLAKLLVSCFLDTDKPIECTHWSKDMQYVQRRGGIYYCPWLLGKQSWFDRI